MTINKLRIATCVLVFYGALLLYGLTPQTNYLSASDGTPTPTSIPKTYGQLFLEEEGCTPMCFFGLVMGESTVEELLGVLNEQSYFVWRPSESVGTNPTVFDEQTGHVEDGSYIIYWNDEQPFDSIAGDIYIKDSVVQLINISNALQLGYDDVFEAFGGFDYLEAGAGLYSVDFDLYYEESGTIISFSIPRNKCSLNNLRSHMFLNNIFYLNASSETTVTRAIPVDIQTWNDWLDSDADISCDEAFAMYLEESQ